MAKYALGIDYGTLSARAVLVDVATGQVLATETCEYRHGVMDTQLPDGSPLGLDYALQHPQDYLDALYAIVPAVLQMANVSKEDVIGIGTDFTACTMIPVRKDGTPLCLEPSFYGEPHAYAKLWRHHAAEDKATAITALAKERQENWLQRYGGKISSEWELPKLWEILEDAPHVYEAMDYFVEAGDWLSWQLTGEQTRSSCQAGYKGHWHKKDGYPSRDFLKNLHPRLEHVYEEKIVCPVTPIGERAGTLKPEIAELLGLLPGTPVAISVIDAHVAMPAAGITHAGQMLAIMGTSTCHILLGESEQHVPGICGVVEDGAFPGYFGYEAGQSCVGDHFAWFVNNGVPESYEEEAKQQNISIHQLLTEKASHVKPGETGLVALDWWNGNRSILVDYDLTGVIVGMTLQTKPEHIYRALIEATAYGTRRIVEAFIESGVPVKEFFACGGIAQKNPMAMQIYADVLQMPIYIVDSNQAPALGAAIYGAVAAGAQGGGYDSMVEATKAMSAVRPTPYTPQAAAVGVYEALYTEYKQLHDYFGCGGNDVLKRLKGLRRSIVEKE